MKDLTLAAKKHIKDLAPHLGRFGKIKGWATRRMIAAINRGSAIDYQVILLYGEFI